MFSWAIGMIVSIYDVWVVLEAIAITTTVVFGLTLYVIISKANFNWLGAGLGIALLVSLYRLNCLLYLDFLISWNHSTNFNFCFSYRKMVVFCVCRIWYI